MDDDDRAASSSADRDLLEKAVEQLAGQRKTLEEINTRATLIALFLFFLLLEAFAETCAS